ncbi:MAG TPA: GNAT family N-acetyltransferase, partial [Actinomycetota bacterium]|nr:GNAT family N-acetyltransferase [Actinomycetota bacterium]
MTTAQLALATRPFRDEDEEQVLALLLASLGPGPAGERSPAFFRWKHLANPFGTSFLLVAEAGGRIIGLRAFLRWRFELDGREVRAVRAVDTATHPDHQGRGIFRRLTLEALDALRGEADLVFNTPNGKSLPGYLKMGWRVVGRVPVSLRVRRPLRLLRGSVGRREAGDPGPPPAVTAPAVGDVLARLRAPWRAGPPDASGGA